MLNEIYDFLIPEVDNSYQVMNYFHSIKNIDRINGNYNKEINFSFNNIKYRLKIFFRK